MGYLDYLALDSADGPVASWHHLETSGTSAADATGNGLTATLGAGITVNQTSTIPGYDGPVVTCSGVSGSTITVPDSNLLDAVDSQGLTYSRWLKMDAAGAGDVAYIIADKTGTANTNKQWTIFWDNRVAQGSPMRLRTQWGYSGANLPVNVDWSGTVARDALLAGGLLTVRFVWQSIGFIYWNGELVASGELTNFPNAPGNVGNTRTLQIGHLSTPGSWFKGQFGPGHVWNRVLSEQEVRNRYLAATGGTLGTIDKLTSNTKIVDTAAYDCFPGLVKCPNGDLVAVFRRGANHSTGSASYGLYQIRSTDGGSTWSAPSQILSNADGQDRRTAALSLIGSTLYLVTWLAPISGTATGDLVRFHTSTDNGATWSAATTVTTDFGYVSCSESPIIKSGSYYYIGIYGQETSTALDFSAAVFRSSDLSTWTRVVTWDTGSTNGYNECAVALIGTTLVALVRRESDTSLYTSTSTDGTTWSTITKSRSFAQSAPRTSVEINGRAYLFLRFTAGGGSAISGGYLAAVDATGEVVEIEPIYDLNSYEYGQLALNTSGDLVGVWGTGVTASDADIYAATWDLPPAKVRLGSLGASLRVGSTAALRAYVGTAQVYGP